MRTTLEAFEDVCFLYLNSKFRILGGDIAIVQSHRLRYQQINTMTCGLIGFRVLQSINPLSPMNASDRPSFQGGEGDCESECPWIWAETVWERGTGKSRLCDRYDMFESMTYSEGALESKKRTTKEEYRPFFVTGSPSKPADGGK